MRIAILDDYQDVALGYADWKGLPGSPEVTVFNEHISRHELLAATLRPFDVIVAMRERTAFPASLLALLPDLGLLVTTGMGNAAIDLAAARDRGVTVCGTGGHPGATGELTWGLILSLTRHIPEEDWRMRAATRAGGAALSSRGSWQRTIGMSLHSKRLGVIGLGRIGREVAAVGQAFGMHVAAWSQNLDPDQAREIDVEPVSKEQLFARSDVVTIHYKLSPRSTGLVGRSWMARRW
jgi:lactate dehydrogenase-like 2-hydroxyacid dehydrogenase